MRLFEVLIRSRVVALDIQRLLVEAGFDTDLRRFWLHYHLGSSTMGTNVIVNVNGDPTWCIHVPDVFPEEDISIYVAKDPKAEQPEYEFDGTFAMYSSAEEAVEAFLQVNSSVAPLDESIEPWLNPTVTKRVALDLQSALLDADDTGDIDVEIISRPPRLKHAAVVENGMTDQFAQFALRVSVDGVPASAVLLIHYNSSVPNREVWRYYHVDTDRLDRSASSILEHIKALLTNKVAKADNLPRGPLTTWLDEDAPLSPHTILSRFAKQLIAKGFEAEVTSKSKPGVVNRSKLGIEVKGYGMKDTLKLYTPFWKHEKGMLAFVDTKTEQRFSTVAEMVEKLKGKYPKLPKCLSFVPKPEKLKESSGKLNIKQRILQLQRDLIEQLPDGSDLSDINKCRGSAYGASGHKDTRFDRYVIVVKYSETAERDSGMLYVITVDDLDTVEVNGVARKSSDGLVIATVYEPKDPHLTFERLQQLDYTKKSLPNLKSVWNSDEVTTGYQTGLDELVAWLADD